jgi:hypothetical protein
MIVVGICRHGTKAQKLVQQKNLLTHALFMSASLVRTQKGVLAFVTTF